MTGRVGVFVRRGLVTALVLHAAASIGGCRDGESPLRGAARARSARSPCASMEEFRSHALAAAPAVDRAALRRWSPPNKVPSELRPAVSRAVRRYVARCGLSQAIRLAGKLISFRTVSARQPPATGPDFRAMADFLRGWSASAGLRWSVFGKNDAWEISLGAGKRGLAFILHADVQPAGDDKRSIPPGWTYPPFVGRLVGERLYGRGAEDDKGPIAATLVVLRALARSGLIPTEEIVAVLGTAEESNWKGMRRYARSRPAAKHTVSVDANFPVVVAEAGFVAWHLSALRRKAASGRRASIISVHAGQFLTQVPGVARLSVRPGRGESARALEARVRAAVGLETKVRKVRGKKVAIRVERSPKTDTVEIRVSGHAVHSSVAWEGYSALWVLASIAQRLKLARGGAESLLRLVAHYFDGDHYGEKIGLAHRGRVVSRLLVVPTMLRSEGTTARLSINMRRPDGLTAAQFGRRLDGALKKIQSEIDPAIRQAKKPYIGDAAVADTSGPLVKTLLEIYRRQTGQARAGTKVIYGGTYARLFPGAVNFGPSLPGKPYRGHAPDEYISVGTLRLLLTTLTQATLRLGFQTGNRE